MRIGRTIDGHEAWVAFHPKFSKRNMKSVEFACTMYRSIFDTTIISQDRLDFKSLVDTLPAHLGPGGWKETAKEAYTKKFASAMESAKAMKLKEGVKRQQLADLKAEQSKDKSQAQHESASNFKFDNGPTKDVSHVEATPDDKTLVKQTDTPSEQKVSTT